MLRIEVNVYDFDDVKQKHKYCRYTYVHQYMPLKIAIKDIFYNLEKNIKEWAKYHKIKLPRSK